MSITRETVLSSLTSGGTANINVAGNTQITGALIATIDENGNDLGQLTLNTGSLSFTDLTDIHQSSQTSGSISTSIGLGAAPQLAKDGEGREMDINTTNITYSNTSQYDASKSLATLGSGNITVGGVLLEKDGELTEAGLTEGSPLDRLNRDTTNLNKDLWNVERTEGNVDLQIDHRMFSEEGRKQIAEDVKRTEILGESIMDIVENSVSLLGNGEGESSIREHIGTKQDYFTATKNFVLNKENAAHVATLGNPDATPTEKQAAYTALVNTIAAQMGIDPTQAKVLIDSDPTFAGAYSTDTKVVYVNDLAHGNAGAAVNTVGHETQHYIDDKKNPNAVRTEQYESNRENYAGIMGNAAEDYLGFNFAQNEYSLTGSNSHSLGTTASQINQNVALVTGNKTNLAQENPDSLENRLNLRQQRSFAQEMDACQGAECISSTINQYKTLADTQNGFSPEQQQVYDYAAGSIYQQLAASCKTSQCVEYARNEMLLLSLSCGSTDCLREQSMSIRNIINAREENWGSLALDAGFDTLQVMGALFPAAGIGKQIGNADGAVRPTLPDGYHYKTINGEEIVSRNPGQAESLPQLRLEDGKLVEVQPNPVSYHRQSELDVGNTLPEGTLAQQAFKDGVPVPHNTPGSVRPDFCDAGRCDWSVEVKNYDLSRSGGQRDLVNDVSAQAVERSAHLPPGMQQQVVIDVRGHNITVQQQNEIRRG